MLAQTFQSFLEPENVERSLQYYEGEFDALIGTDPSEVIDLLKEVDYAEGFVAGSIKRIYNLAIAKYSQK